MAKKVVIVGGGWSGCSAALEAKKAGCDVELFERTDMLLGTGLVGGIMRNNGRYTVTEEMLAMGGGELFRVADAQARHTNIEFPGHKHANLYDVSRIEPAVRSEWARSRPSMVKPGTSTGRSAKRRFYVVCRTPIQARYPTKTSPSFSVR